MIREIEDLLINESMGIWQGKGAKIDMIQSAISRTIEIISEKCANHGFGGIEFPMEYITDATYHYIDAIEKKDDYLLADNLYFEWREIIEVYIELIEGMDN